MGYGYGESNSKHRYFKQTQTIIRCVFRCCRTTSQESYLILVGQSNEFYFANSNNKKREIIAVLAKVISDYDKNPYAFYEIEKYLKKVTGLK